MTDADDILQRFMGNDPIAGIDALNTMVALGEQGENALFSRPLVPPGTHQVYSRWLRYAATRRSTVLPRLLERVALPRGKIIDRQYLNDAKTAAELLACAPVTQATLSAIEVQFNARWGSNHFDKRLRRDYRAEDIPLIMAWGYAGGSSGVLWKLVTDSRRAWENLGNATLEAACITFARTLDRSSGSTIQKLITHSWSEYTFEVFNDRFQSIE